jgi:hypothetical protein
MQDTEIKARNQIEFLELVNSTKSNKKKANYHLDRAKHSILSNKEPEANLLPQRATSSFLFSIARLHFNEQQSISGNFLQCTANG